MSLAKILKLDKPLVLIDLETTGPSPSKDRICQIGLIKIYPDGDEKYWMTLIKPGVIIPPEVSEIHGIKDEDVVTAPLFEDIAGVLYKGLVDCYLGGYQVRFDLDFLDYSFERVGAPFDADAFLLIDAFQIFKHYHPRDLTAALKHYTGKELAGAHNADVDIGATKDVLEAQFDQHPDLPRTVQELHTLLFFNRGNKIDRHGKFLWNDGNEAVLDFGKHRGKLLRDVPHSYLKWIAYEADDFSPKARRIAREALNGRFPVRQSV